MVNPVLNEPNYATRELGTNRKMSDKSSFERLISQDRRFQVFNDTVPAGIGIAIDDIPKALAPFSQIDGDLNRKYEGTGLGLPLAKSLVELHGGSLNLQSEVDIGTTVTVRFPAKRINTKER